MFHEDSYLLQVGPLTGYTPDKNAGDFRTAQTYVTITHNFLSVHNESNTHTDDALQTQISFSSHAPFLEK